MKKKVVLMLMVAMVMSVTACGGAAEDAAVKDVVESSAESPKESTAGEGAAVETAAPEEAVAPTEKPGFTFTQIKESPDKYTWYVKDYVGKNCATIGYSSYSGRRYDAYGATTLRLIFVTADGSYVDVESEEVLKNYVVTGQNLEPNTEIRLTFEKDSEGNELDYSVMHQSQKEIVLTVKQVGTDAEYGGELTVINSSPDKYTYYISDYVGRNLVDCGYVAYSGNIYDQYGVDTIQLVVVSSDGSFIDPEDEGQTRGYVVVGQSVAPNTELKYTYEKDSNGVEVEWYAETQNLSEIDLYVSLIPGYVPPTPEPTEAPEETVMTERAPEQEVVVPTDAPEVLEEKETAKTESELVDGMRPEFKEAMDSYEAFYMEYCDFTEKYNQNPSDLTLLAEYFVLLTKMEEMEEDFAAWTEEDLNDAEFAYYLEVSSRVAERLAEVAG